LFLIWQIGRLGVALRTGMRSLTASDGLLLVAVVAWFVLQALVLLVQSPLFSLEHSSYLIVPLALLAGTCVPSPEAAMARSRNTGGSVRELADGSLDSVPVGADP
jgi:hypothetical protein